MIGLELEVLHCHEFSVLFISTGALKNEKSSPGNETAMVMGFGFLFLVIFLVLFQMYRNYRRVRSFMQYAESEILSVSV